MSTTRQQQITDLQLQRVTVRWDALSLFLHFGQLLVDLAIAINCLDDKIH